MKAEQFTMDGMTWWNKLSPEERRERIEQATLLLNKPASIADAWAIELGRRARPRPPGERAGRRAASRRS
jgi:hypothetical protein